MSRRVLRLRSAALMWFSGDPDLFLDNAALFFVERGEFFFLGRVLFLELSVRPLLAGSISSVESIVFNSCTLLSSHGSLHYHMAEKYGA